MIDTIFISHSADTDGWACEAIGRRFYDKSAQYFRYNYGESVEHILEAAKDKHLVMADITFDYPTLQRFLKVCKSITIYDHHITVWNDYTRIINGEIARFADGGMVLTAGDNERFSFHFDNERSACELLWNRLFSESEMANQLFKAINSRK